MSRSIFALASTALLVGVGSGVDLSRAFFARQKLSQVANADMPVPPRAPSAVNTGANAIYVAYVNQFASNALASQNWPASSLPTGGPTGTSANYFTSTGAYDANTSQEPTGVAELWYNMPTAFLKIINISQIRVHAVLNCQPPAKSTSSTPGSMVVQEGFETGQGGFYFTQSQWSSRNDVDARRSSFPANAGYQGDNGNQFYIMGYCLEIDAAGVISASDPQGTHSAELDCDNGSGAAGNSSISTRAQLNGWLLRATLQLQIARGLLELRANVYLWIHRIRPFVGQ